MTEPQNTQFTPPTPPAILIELLRLLKDPEISASQIANLISKDPGLTGHILRSVNSSFFGVAERVGSLLQAVALLGNRTLKMVSLSYCLKRFVRSAASGGFDYNRFWQYSLSAGVAANLLSRQLGRAGADEAFVAGLMSRIGCPALHQANPEAYKQVLTEYAAGGRALHHVERDVLGNDHAEVGAKILADWKLPEHMIEAVACQHDPELCADPKAHDLALVLFGAGQMAVCLSKKHCEEAYRTMLMNCCERLDMDFEQAEALFTEVSEKSEEAAGLFAVTYERGEEAETIMAEAHKHMEQLQNEVDSVVAELRATATL
jgi:HD-like signal output (HDOD) protein